MQIDFTARGNAVGFTSDGRIVTGWRREVRKCSSPWIIAVGFESTPPALHQKESFATKREAIAHAARLVDERRTRELAWWTV